MKEKAQSAFINSLQSNGAEKSSGLFAITTKHGLLNSSKPVNGVGSIKNKVKEQSENIGKKKDKFTFRLNHN